MPRANKRKKQITYQKQTKIMKYENDILEINYDGDEYKIKEDIPFRNSSIDVINDLIETFT